MTSSEGPKRVADDVVPPSQEEWPRRSWSTHREQVRAANRARKKAVDKLIVEHWDQWVELYTAACAASTPVVEPNFRLPDPETAEQIEAEIALWRNLLRSMEAS